MISFEHILFVRMVEHCYGYAQARANRLKVKPCKIFCPKMWRILVESVCGVQLLGRVHCTLCRRSDGQTPGVNNTLPRTLPSSSCYWVWASLQSFKIAEVKVTFSATFSRGKFQTKRGTLKLCYVWSCPKMTRWQNKSHFWAETGLHLWLGNIKRWKWVAFFPSRNGRIAFIFHKAGGVWIKTWHSVQRWIVNNGRSRRSSLQYVHSWSSSCAKKPLN